MYNVITLFVCSEKKKKGINLKDYEERDEVFQNDSDYEYDGFVVADDEPLETCDQEIVEPNLLERSCKFVGNYMKSMLQIFGNESDSEDEEDGDFEPNEDSSDEDSELEKSQSDDENSEENHFQEEDVQENDVEYDEDVEDEDEEDSDIEE